MLKRMEGMMIQGSDTPILIVLWLSEGVDML